MLFITMAVASDCCCSWLGVYYTHINDRVCAVQSFMGEKRGATKSPIRNRPALLLLKTSYTIIWWWHSHLSAIWLYYSCLHVRYYRRAYITSAVIYINPSCPAVGRPSTYLSGKWWKAPLAERAERLLLLQRYQSATKLSLGNVGQCRESWCRARPSI